MATDDMRSRIRAVLGDALELELNSNEITDEVIGSLDLQSFQLVRVVVGLEKEFGVEPPDEWIASLPTNLSVDSIAALIGSVLG